MKITFYITDDEIYGIERAEVAIELGKPTVIIGPNGSGKSRIFERILGFFDWLGDDNINAILEFEESDEELPYIGGKEIGQFLDSIGGTYIDGVLEDLWKRSPTEGEREIVAADIAYAAGPVAEMQFHPRYLRTHMNFFAIRWQCENEFGLDPDETFEKLEAETSYIMSQSDLAGLKNVICPRRYHVDHRYNSRPVYTMEEIENAKVKLERAKADAPTIHKAWSLIFKEEANIQRPGLYGFERTAFSLEKEILPKPVYIGNEQRLENILEDLEKLVENFAGNIVELVAGIPLNLVPRGEFADNVTALKGLVQSRFLNEVATRSNEPLNNWRTEFRIDNICIPNEDDDIRELTCIIEKGALKFNAQLASEAEKLWLTMALRKGIGNAYWGLTPFFGDITEWAKEIFDELRLTQDLSDGFGEEELELLTGKLIITAFRKSLVKESDANMPAYLKAWKYIYLIDEPELHLHPASQRRTARRFEDICREQNSFLIVTHSNCFIEMSEANWVFTDSSKGYMNIQTHPLKRPDAPPVLREMGWNSVNDLPHFLFVEGKHDKWVIEGLFGGFLSWWNIVVHELDGAWNTDILINPFTAAVQKFTEDSRFSIVMDSGHQRLFSLVGDAANRRRMIDEFKRMNNIKELEWQPLKLDKYRRDLAGIMEETSGAHIENWHGPGDGFIREELRKSPQITALLLEALGYRSKTIFLRKKDIVEYLDVGVVEKMRGLPKGAIIKAESRTVTASQRRKEAFQAQGIKINEAFIKGVCSAMHDKHIIYEGHDLWPNVKQPIGELVEVMAQIAQYQGYDSKS